VSVASFLFSLKEPLSPFSLLLATRIVFLLLAGQFDWRLFISFFFAAPLPRRNSPRLSALSSAGVPTCLFPLLSVRAILVFLPFLLLASGPFTSLTELPSGVTLRTSSLRGSGRPLVRLGVLRRLLLPCDESHRLFPPHEPGVFSSFERNDVLLGVFFSPVDPGPVRAPTFIETVFFLFRVDGEPPPPHSRVSGTR